MNEMITDKPKTVIAGGPTASGKSDTALKLCRDLNGGLISRRDGKTENRTAGRAVNKMKGD